MTNSFGSPAWPRRPLAQIAEVFLGLASLRHVAEDAGGATVVSVINVRDLDDGRVAPRDRLEVRAVAPGLPADRYRVRADDVLITCRGTQLKVAQVGEGVEGAVISSNLIAIRPGPDLLAPVLFAYFRSTSGRAALRGRNRSSNLTLALSPTSIGRIEVPVPPFEAQRRIADLVQAAEENYAAAVGAAEWRRKVAHEVAIKLLTGALADEPKKSVTIDPQEGLPHGVPDDGTNEGGEAPCTE